MNLLVESTVVQKPAFSPTSASFHNVYVHDIPQTTGLSVGASGLQGVVVPNSLRKQTWKALEKMSNLHLRKGNVAFLVHT